MCIGISSSANRLLIITSFRITLMGPLSIGTNTPVARAISSAISAAVDSPLLLLADDDDNDGYMVDEDVDVNVNEDRWCCGYPWCVIRLCSCLRAEGCDPPNFMKTVGVASASSSASSASLRDGSWASVSSSSSSALAISSSWSPPPPPPLPPWREEEE